jgi:hypothetical protein
LAGRSGSNGRSSLAAKSRATPVRRQTAGATWPGMEDASTSAQAVWKRWRLKRTDSVSMCRALRYGNLCFLSLAIASVCCSSGPISYYVSQIRIDNAQRVLPIGPRSIGPPNLPSYFWFFHAGRGFTTVAHFENAWNRSTATRVLFGNESGATPRLDRQNSRDSEG